ncbi:T9SS type A sorting domain-containing protein, partial [Aestuariivivens sediminicola]|uniref:T9SS type A sorting domain-containing protein n=1 Tax=Aestuariivivens sediminicola TaxID=2913560 RepID=UPI001F57FFDC
SNHTVTFCDEDHSGTTLSAYDGNVGPGTGYTVVWYTDSGRTAGNEITVTGDLPASGSPYTYYARVTNDTTGCDADATLTININPTPVVSNHTVTFCDEDHSGTTLSAYDGNVGPGTGYTVVWYTDSGRTTGNEITVTGDLPASGSPYTYYARVTNDTTGCDADATLTITINPTPTCNASADNPLACEGQAIQLRVSGANGIGPYTYVWSGAAASYFSDVNSAEPTFNAPIGIYNLTVTVTDTGSSDNCTNTCQVSVEVYDCTPNCGTAFAVATQDVGGFDSVIEDEYQDTYSSCFRNDDFKRWGWTNAITAEGTYRYAVYRGAGRCDLSKGTYVGDLVVTYEGGRVDFSYDILTWDHDKNPATDEVPLYLISEVHLFVGCDPYPTKANSEEYTVAPGQYPYNANIPDGDYYPGWEAYKTGVTGSFYFIAHAVICDRDIPYPDDMHIPGEQRDYDDIDLEFNASFMDTECTVNTGGWGKPDGKVNFTAYPVPFQNEVNIGYKFEYNTDVKIDVYDIKGALIRQAENTSYLKGTYDRTNIDLSGNDDQMYFVRVTTKEGTLVKKIVSSTDQK